MTGVLRVSRFRSPLTSELVGASVSDDTRHLGVAWDTHPDAAAARALGEARERRWAHSPPATKTLSLARVHDLETQFALGGIVQFASLTGEPYSGGWPLRDGDQPVYVVPSTAGVAIPAGLVWFDLPLGPGLPPLRETGSNGLASAASLSEASEHARWELFERDVAMRLHLGTAASRPIAVPEALGSLVSELESSGVFVHCGIVEPHVAVAAITSDRRDLPRATVATAARPRAADAIRAAILEGLQVYHFAMQAIQGSRAGARSISPSNQAERAIYWARNPGDGWKHYVGTDLVVKSAGATPNWDTVQIVAGDDHGAVVRAVSPSFGHLSPSDRFPVHVSTRYPATNSTSQIDFGIHPFV